MSTPPPASGPRRSWWSLLWTSRHRTSLVWRLSVPVACACAGLLATTSMINARGTDLRGGRHSDLTGILSEQRDKVAELRDQARAIQHDIDALTQQISGTRIDQINRKLDRLGPPAGLTALVGPGVVVELDDAPLNEGIPDGVDPNLLIVHQQDIQAVVNALWAGGAEGISLQGQRIISTTGIKCVGNTVVLQGVPYSPPYKIAAVGNSTQIYAALVASPDVQNYRGYVNPPYNLGWSLRDETKLTVPSYQEPLALEYAQPVNSN